MPGQRAAFALLWLAGAASAILYARYKQIPPAVAIPIALAFLVELSLFLATSLESVRRRWEQTCAPLPWSVALTALVPYLALSLGTSRSRWSSAALVLALALVATAWFRILPAGRSTDAGFLAWMAGVYLARVFRWIYVSPVDGVEVEALGQLMWIRVGVFSALMFRCAGGIGFGLLPSRKEWITGARWFLLFLPVGTALAIGLRFATFGLVADWWWKAPATFLGILWVVALGEEFFFRGLLQQWAESWWGKQAGLAAASALFGLAHLGFRAFPNWKMALLAGAAGCFYGLAYRSAGTIRAAMVTHALAVTTWRTFAS